MTLVPVYGYDGLSGSRGDYHVMSSQSGLDVVFLAQDSGFA